MVVAASISPGDRGVRTSGGVVGAGGAGVVVVVVVVAAAAVVASCCCSSSSECLRLACERLGEKSCVVDLLVCVSKFEREKEGKRNE